MTRSSGTTNGGNGLSLLANVHTAINAHAAWTHVKTVTNTPATGDDWRIYKCLGTSNSIGTDFFISLFYDASDPDKLQGNVHEDFNSTTNEVITYGPASATSTSSICPPVGPNARPITGGSNHTVPNNMDSTTKQGHMFYSARSTLTNATTFDYDISVTNDRVIVCTDVINSSNALYLGGYEDLVQVANNFPIVCAPLAYSGTGFAGATRLPYVTFTRHPGRENQAGNTNHFMGHGPSTSICTWTAAKALSSANNAADLFAGGKAHASRLAVMQSTASTTISPVYGALRGLYRDVLAINADSGVLVGDTFTFGADVYDVVARYSSSVGTDVILIKQGV